MTRITVTPQPLTQAAFQPFGQVIEVSDAATHYTINDGNTERYHDLARIEPGTNGRAIVSIFRGLQRQLPFELNMMERHPLGSQAFIPMSGKPYLVVVAAPGKAPTVEDLTVFYCRADQGVNYDTGVWHHPLLALDAVSDFIVIDRSGPDNNCDVVQLDPGGLIVALG